MYRFSAVNRGRKKGDMGYCKKEYESESIPDKVRDYKGVELLFKLSCHYAFGVLSDVKAKHPITRHNKEERHCDAP